MRWPWVRRSEMERRVEEQRNIAASLLMDLATERQGRAQLIESERALLDPLVRKLTAIRLESDAMENKYRIAVDLSAQMLWQAHTRGESDLLAERVGVMVAQEIARSKFIRR